MTNQQIIDSWANGQPCTEPITRCKDCKHTTKPIIQPKHNLVECVIATPVWRDGWWFCADGTRDE